MFFLYLNDVGILTNILYRNNIRAVLDDVKSINLGTVYESVVASELKAHGFNLFYYDNRSKGEVDYERTANVVFDEFRKGMLNRISLEDPNA